MTDTSPKIRRIRHNEASETELEKLVASVPEDVLTQNEKQKYLATRDAEAITTWKKVVQKGELFTVQEFSDSEVGVFNQQVSNADMAILRQQLTPKQLIEAVKMLPEFNFNIEETLKQIQNKKNRTPCFECGVAGCQRLQERWQGRMIHGAYPNIPLVEFQHDKFDQKPSCYYVPYDPENPMLSKKFDDVSTYIAEIERQ